MLQATRHRPEEILGIMDPLKARHGRKSCGECGDAGCYPEYFPVVLASVKGRSSNRIPRRSTACTTGGAAPVVIVSGPIAAKGRDHSGTCCFGGGSGECDDRPRAAVMTMRNVGGAEAGR